MVVVSLFMLAGFAVRVPSPAGPAGGVSCAGRGSAPTLRPMRTLVLGVLTVAGLLGSASADAEAENDSQSDLLGPREIAVGEAMRGGATGSTAIGLNPAGL